MLFELILIGLTALLIWDYLYKKHRNDMFKKYKISGPPALPVLGNAIQLRDLNADNVIEKRQEDRRKYGKIFRYWVLNQVTVFVQDVKYLELILSSQQLIKKSSFYVFLSDWLGTGLLMNSGKIWYTRRKIITPTFHFKILEQFLEIFDQQSNVLTTKLYAQADGKTVINIFPIVCLMALDVIAESAMGVKLYAQEHPEIEYVRSVAHVTQVMSDRVMAPTQRMTWLFRLTAPVVYRKMVKSIAKMHDFTNNVIAQRRAALKQSLAEGKQNGSNGATDAGDDIGAKKRMALLDMLLHSTVDGKPLSNEDIREEVDTFMFAGHDTTTSGISFCLYLISRYPEVQKKLVEEIHEVFDNDKERAVTYRDLQELKYLECVIKETLRLYPSVPYIGRETTEDIQIGDIVLPAKTNLSLSFFMALRDPDYFSDPNEFKPERFAKDAAEKINPFAYTPFSAGPRNCIGQKFAMLEMKSTVSKVLRHFELLPLGETMHPAMGLVMRPANGVDVGLKPRTE